MVRKQELFNVTALKDQPLMSNRVYNCPCEITRLVILRELLQSVGEVLEDDRRRAL